MKISKLHIDSFRHLENLDFDFTYQSGERKGEPLDKICFIGQSATGKTGLLEFIFKEFDRLQKAVLFEDITENKKAFYESRNNVPSGTISFTSYNINRTFKTGEKNTEPIFYEYQNKNEYSNFETEEHLPVLKEEEAILYFKASLISDKNIDIFTKNPIDLIEIYRKNTELNIENLLDKSFDRLNFVFDNDVNPRIWLFLLSEILEYRKNFTQRISELIHIKDGSVDLSNLGLEIQKWQKENPNKVELFADKFNPILKKLSLEVDMVNTEYPIPIKNKRTNEIIGLENTSTGTKGLLLSFLPLYKLETKDSIILIDEPERSLYPDMQMDLMDHYKRLAPKAQFIIATHSPFIAASFEPDERFILYFDEEGKVAVRRGSSPIGDDPNDILKNDFKLESLMNEKGVEAFEKYRNLKKRLAVEKNEDKKDKLLEEILSLANAYKF